MLPTAEVRQLLSAATVFVCPSVYEPLGIVNLEAMACGTAVVASDVGGIPEVVDDGETGLLVHYDEHAVDEFRAGLAEAVNALLADPGRAAAMGAAGRERAEREFAWAQAAARTVEIYRVAGLTARGRIGLGPVQRTANGTGGRMSTVPGAVRWNRARLEGPMPSAGGGLEGVAEVAGLLGRHLDDQAATALEGNAHHDAPTLLGHLQGTVTGPGLHRRHLLLPPSSVQGAAARGESARRDAATHLSSCLERGRTGAINRGAFTLEASGRRW